MCPSFGRFKVCEYTSCTSECWLSPLILISGALNVDQHPPNCHHTKPSEIFRNNHRSGGVGQRCCVDVRRSAVMQAGNTPKAPDRWWLGRGGGSFEGPLKTKDMHFEGCEPWEKYFILVASWFSCPGPGLDVPLLTAVFTWFQVCCSWCSLSS